MTYCSFACRIVGWAVEERERGVKLPLRALSGPLPKPAEWVRIASRPPRTAPMA